MKLEPIEEDIMIGIYKMSLSKATISMEEYILEGNSYFEQKQEFYSYLRKLKKLHYIELRRKILHSGERLVENMALMFK